MENRWNDDEARAAVTLYGARGVGEELALRVYTSRLIGGDPALVLHGGGNTSVKGTGRDATGDEMEVLYVKGSGWDLATIEPEGFPAVRLEPIRALRGVERLTDEEMVNALRVKLLDASAPNPSVEALLHAFLPHRFVDHTHADAVLALVDQPDPEARCAEAFGDRLAVLPFVFPGFSLAGEVMRAYEADPSVEGIVLIQHGLFTFGETARESYERMIRYVGAAEAALAQSGPRVFAARQGLRPLEEGDLVRLAPIVRGALALSQPGGGEPRRMVLHFRGGPAVRAFVDGEAVADYALRGVATPDHIIRTKNLPLLLPPWQGGDVGGGEEGFARATREAVAAYVQAYHAYFAQGAAASSSPKTELDPLPRVVLLPGAGFFAAGATEKAARIAADLYEHTIAIIAAAEGLGRYQPLGPARLFEMEYWSLEQAKLGQGAEKSLARRVALITGAASGIGAATAEAFAAEGAHLVLVDRDGAALEQAAARVAALAPGVEAVAADVTDPDAVEGAFRRAVLRFGGVDIVVSNAGRVWQGPIADVSPETLRESFELNFFSHQQIAARAVTIFQAQGSGGHLLFNASKSAFNPGPGMGPYTLPKAALVALMKQYALEYGAIGVRSNAVNADRVDTALFGQGVLQQRAAARGLSVDQYLSGNLLGQAVRPQDVAQAFVHLALSQRTTGTVLPVDGGNIAASPR
ncbi:MAG: bifunctional aldolase/short-chain dehydrogenase [bacterium]